MKLFKVISSIACLSVTLSIFSFSLQAASIESIKAYEPTQEEVKVAEETQAMEDLFYSEALKEANIEVNEFTKNYFKNKEKSKSRLTEDDELILDNKIKDIYVFHEKNAKLKSKEWKLENGWVEVFQTKQATNVGVLSNSSQLQLTDEAVMYNASTLQYQFSAEYNFVDKDGWDYDGDIEDIMAVRTNKKINIVKGYGKTYKENQAKCASGETYVGTIPYSVRTESGYDNNGVNATTSKVNKRFANDYGYVWNVIDEGRFVSFYTNMCKSSSGTIYGGSRVEHDTDGGRVTLYYKKGESGTSTAYLDYEHNYKTGSVDASFSSTGLTSVGLNIAYSTSNYHYQRTSTGRSY